MYIDQLFDQPTQMDGWMTQSALVYECTCMQFMYWIDWSLFHIYNSTSTWMGTNQHLSTDHQPSEGNQCCDHLGNSKQ